MLHWQGERCKAETLFELHKLPAIINWGIERAGRQCTCTISHATFLQKCILCDSMQEIMRHLHAYTTQLALLDMYASLAHVRHRGQTYQLASGMLGARREGPANAPTSQAAARRCRNSRRLATRQPPAHAKCKRHMLNASDASFYPGTPEKHAAQHFLSSTVDTLSNYLPEDPKIGA